VGAVAPMQSSGALVAQAQQEEVWGVMWWCWPSGSLPCNREVCARLVGLLLPRAAPCDWVVLVRSLLLCTRRHDSVACFSGVWGGRL